MPARLWKEVDDYITGKLLPGDAVLEDALQANADNGLPAYDVSPAQGKLLHILVKMSGARRVLEIGTLGGYSTIWMARALAENSRLVTLEYSERHAEVARRNIARAGLAEKVEIRVGEAAKSLPDLASDEPFDFVFIDADKLNNALYLDWAVKLTRSGAVIVCDNVIRDGAVIEVDSGDASVQGSREAFEFISARPELTATAIQTVGAKGYDGFVVMIRN